MRRFAIGDIHGGYRALLQCLERSGFDYKNDKLIVLGDVCDGWPQVPHCFNELSKIDDLVYVIGNHDVWALEWMKTGIAQPLWLKQGGAATRSAYIKAIDLGDEDVVSRHVRFLDDSVFYYEMDGMLFVHGGFDWHHPIREQENMDLTWDRHMWTTAAMWNKRQTGDKINDYDRVFIGHTTTSLVDPDLLPVQFTNIINLDQGAGYEGKLTIMDVDTEEYWQSDVVKDLYPNHKGRS